MAAGEALLVFLRGSLGTKQDRIVDFATRPKARAKFLALLYHQLGALFRESSVVARLPDRVWALPAFRFTPPDGFGAPISRLRTAYDEDGQNELVITADGLYGYWRDEIYADSEVLISADLNRPVAGIR